MGCNKLLLTACVVISPDLREAVTESRGAFVHTIDVPFGW
jgi:hypothetical protein